MGAERCVLVSACLLGVRCRYDGCGKALDGLERLNAVARLIPVCPEQLGGLPTPRTPCERRDGRVVSRAGDDETEAFERGAAETLRLTRLFHVRYALLKARSPSCGSGGIYDGSFSGRTIPGDGVAAEALRAAGVRMFNETQIDELLNLLEESRA